MAENSRRSHGRHTHLRTLGQHLKLGARYYNTTTGRFTQPDPSGQEPNNYNYASCNPTNNTDPTGRCSWGHAVGGCVAGAAATYEIAVAASVVLGPEAGGLVLTTACLGAGVAAGFALDV